MVPRWNPSFITLPAIREPGLPPLIHGITPRLLAFTGVPGSPESWDEGMLKVVLRDSKNVKLSKEEKVRLCSEVDQFGRFVVPCWMVLLDMMLRTW